MFLARPLRDQCSSVPKSVQQSRAKVAHGLFTFVASFPHFATSDALATAQYHESADSDRISLHTTSSSARPRWPRTASVLRRSYNHLQRWQRQALIDFIATRPIGRDILARAGEPAASRHVAPAVDHAFILTVAPIAFQPECPLFMYFASKPASRSLIAVLQPT